MDRLPTEILIMIIEHIYSPGKPIAEMGPDCEGSSLSYEKALDKNSICSLRLVNTRLSQVAARYAFRYLRVSWNPCFDSMKIKSESGLYKLSQTSHAEFVHGVFFWINTFRDPLTKYRNIMKNTLVPSLLQFKNLKYLTFGSTLFQRTFYGDLLYAILLHGSNICLEQLELSCHQLHLLDLFASKCPRLGGIDQAMSRIRHLTVHFQQGYSSRGISIASALARIPRELALRLGPNHNAWAIKFIELAPKLESLTLLQSWGDRNITRKLSCPPNASLRRLEINDMVVLPSDLLSAIIQYKDTLKHLNLINVDLGSGTWPFILLRLCTTTKLLSFLAFRLGCSLQGNNNRRSPSNNLSSGSFLSPGILDEAAMGEIQRQVYGNRTTAGLLLSEANELRKSAEISELHGTYHTGVYDCINKPSVQDVVHLHPNSLEGYPDLEQYLLQTSAAGSQTD